jgi:hypothetical protein
MVVASQVETFPALATVKHAARGPVLVAFWSKLMSNVEIGL